MKLKRFLLMSILFGGLGMAVVGGFSLLYLQALPEIYYSRGQVAIGNHRLIHRMWEEEDIQKMVEMAREVACGVDVTEAVACRLLEDPEASGLVLDETNSDEEQFGRVKTIVVTHLTVRRMAEEPILEFEVRANNGHLAQAIVNNAMTAFVENEGEERQRITADLKEWFNARITTYEDSVTYYSALLDTDLTPSERSEAEFQWDKYLRLADDYLEKKYEIERNEEASAFNETEVIAWGDLPQRPVYPRPGLIILSGLGIGLALGVALALVFQGIVFIFSKPKGESGN